MGRVYSDPSSFVQGYLLGHYAPVFDRFFEAFARALPACPAPSSAGGCISRSRRWRRAGGR